MIAHTVVPAALLQPGPWQARCGAGNTVGPLLTALWGGGEVDGQDSGRCTALPCPALPCFGAGRLAQAAIAIAQLPNVARRASASRACMPCTPSDCTLLWSLPPAVRRGTISAADIVTDAIVYPEPLDSFLPPDIKEVGPELRALNIEVP